MVLAPVIIITGVIFRIRDFKISSGFDSGTQAFDACCNDFRAPDEDWFSKAFINKDLNGAENAFVFTFGKDDALRV